MFGINKNLTDKAAKNFVLDAFGEVSFLNLGLNGLVINGVWFTVSHCLKMQGASLEQINNISKIESKSIRIDLKKDYSRYFNI